MNVPLFVHDFRILMDREAPLHIPHELLQGGQVEIFYIFLLAFPLQRAIKLCLVGIRQLEHGRISLGQVLLDRLDDRRHLHGRDDLIEEALV